jgi:hypothetical protein
MMKRGILALVFIGLAITNAIGQKQGPEIKFEKTEHDYGDIMEKGGKANYTFWFTNTGDDTLRLTRVQPGCGCTASDWTKTPILPGEKGMVSSAYDPLGRPGPFRKSIMVVSTAKSSPTISLFIKGNVIPKAKDFTDTFRVHLGDLLFERNNPVFHNLRHDEVRIDTVRFYNNSNIDMTLAIKEAPAHIKVRLSVNKLKPQQRGYMVLNYDAGRIQVSGNRNDKIFLQTNDPKQESKMIFVTAQILERPAQPAVEQLYPFQMGNFRMTKNNVVFPTILNSETKTDSLIIYNSGTKAIQVDFQKPPAHVKASMSSSVVLPGTTATLIVTYDASKAEGFGFLSNDRLFLQTTDTVQPLKVIYLSANVKEDFSKMTAKQRANAPVIEFDNKNFDFGTRPTGPAIPHSFVFRNNGKSDLIIRKVHASCGCTATHPEKTTLKPGESSKIDIVFDTKGRSGDQYKNITVITNDPEHPEVLLQVKGKLSGQE